MRCTPATATVLSPDPDRMDVRNAFQAYIQGSQYINCERIEYNK
jgi:hypothetical protein